MAKLLVVEDEASMAAALRDGFEYEGYTVLHAGDGEAALALIRGERPDLVVLDVMLPKLSGLDVCKRLRADGNRVPVLMLTARSQEIDKVLGLKIGADDYVTKPFSFAELLARVEALLRRAEPTRGGEEPPAGTRRFGDVEVDFEKEELRRGGAPVELSRRELRLLAFFLRNQGRALTRQEILDAVWDYETAPLTRTVDMHVAKLRRKVEADPANPRHILTVHRVGYKFKS